VPGTGSIYRLATGEFVGTIHDGDASGLAAAKVALAAGGLLQMGPGTEGISLGAGWGIIALARIDALGRMFLSRFNMTDGTDPTKVLAWDLSALTTATTRTITAHDWSGHLLAPSSLGTGTEFLKSSGAASQPTWAAVTITNALLDGANHTDTIAKAAAQGALIVGVAGPSWDRLTIGAANTVLTSNGTDVSWSANPAVQHDTLSHLKPVAVAACTWTTGTDLISSVNLPGTVKVGDYVYLGTNAGTQNQGRKVIALDPANTRVQVDGLNGNSTITSQTFIFQPGDHFNDTVALHTGTGAGLLMTLGRGTYSTAVPSGTFQEMHGPFRWGTFNNTILSDFRVAGYSGGTAAGFGIYDASFPTRVAYWNVGSLTGPANFTLPPTGGNVMTDTSTNNAITGTKHFTGSIILDSDGTAARTVFQTAGGANFLAFAPSGTTLRVATWQDRDGTVAYLDDIQSPAYAPGSFTMADGTYHNHVKQLRLTTTQRLTMAGDSRFVLAN